MSKKEIMSAMERTIEEANMYRKENPEDDFGLMAINEHRASLEAQLDTCDFIHPSPLRAIATSFVAPIGLVLSPAILVVGLAYLGGRAIYDKIKENYSK
ncbi:hypothetical protein JW711_01890 [Candidatus Woesearchaeota archaeon]|nr:hypothetical protein [Candidatus Woesearchaeota archaeon]